MWVEENEIYGKRQTNTTNNNSRFYPKSHREEYHSPKTITAYQTDLRQFAIWIAETDLLVNRLDQVTRMHISEYLAFLAGKGLTGVTRARKLASIREFFKF